MKGSSMEAENLGDAVRDLLGRFAPSSLVSARARDDVAMTLRRLPLSTSRIFGFESRLSTPTEQTDFFMRITQSTCAELISAAWQGTPLLSGTGWAPVSAFVDTWMDPGSTELADRIRHIWLEFDCEPLGADSAVPGILFVHPLRGESARVASSAATVDLTEATHRLITGDPTDPQTRNNLVTCLDALPPGASVFCVGIMVGRADSSIRLCLQGLAPGTHLSFLERAGVPQLDGLSDVFRSFEPMVDRINVDLDVGTSMGSRVHLEMRCDADVAPEPEVRWRAFMDALIEQGLVIESRGNALLEWSGFPLEDLRGTVGERLFLRKLSHVKQVWSSGEVREVKGYFGAWDCLNPPAET